MRRASLVACVGLALLSGGGASGESSSAPPEARFRVDPAAVQKAMQDEIARSMKLIGSPW